MASLSSIIKSSFPNDLMFCGFYVVKKLIDLDGNITEETAIEVGPYCSDILATPRINVILIIYYDTVWKRIMWSMLGVKINSN